MDPLLLPSYNPTRPFWSLPAHSLTHYRTTSDIPPFADVTIIGAGFSGTSAAFHLSIQQPHIKVLILDARGPAGGATGRNGGHLTPVSYRNFRRDVKRWGRDIAIGVRILERENVKEVVELVRRLKVDCDLQEGTGNFHVFCTEKDWLEAKEDLKCMKECPEGAKIAKEIAVFEKYEARKRLNSPDIIGALHIPAHQLHPAKLIHHLLTLTLVNPNHNLQTDTLALRIGHSSTSHIIYTSRGVIETRTLILATNAWTSTLLPSLWPKITPVRAQCIAFRAHETEEAVGMSFHTGSEYVCRRRDGIIVLGGGRSSIPGKEIGLADDSLLNPLVSDALRCFWTDHFPRASSYISILAEWSGIMGYTPNTAPIVGEIPTCKNLFVCAGFGGHGMPLCFQAGREVAKGCARNLGFSANEKKNKEEEAVTCVWEFWRPKSKLQSKI